MSKIKVVLFDIGNVLMLAAHQRTIEDYILRHGIPRDLAEGYFQRPDYAETGKGRLEWHDYCERLRMEWRVSISDDEINSIDASHIYAVDLGALSLVEVLMAKMPVGFVTNTCIPEWERYVQLEPRFASQFKTWRSDIHGHYKADPGVPEDIIDRWIPRHLKVKAGRDEVLFVDDSQGNCKAFSDIGAEVFTYTERQPWLLAAYLKQIGLLP